MEFIVELDGPATDLGRIDETLRTVDPAALVDEDAGRLRIAGAFDARTLVMLLQLSGQGVAPAQVRQLPSVCCGGCSG